MNQRILAFVLVGAASLAAAAGGVFLATRESAEVRSAGANDRSTSANSQGTPAEAGPAGGGAVAETEEVIGREREASAGERPGQPGAPPAAARVDSTPSPARSTATPVQLPAAKPGSARTTSVSAPATEPTTARRRPSAPVSAPAPDEEWPATGGTTSGHEYSVEQPNNANRGADAAAATGMPGVVEPVRPAIPERTFEELVVPADSVVGLQVEGTITSESARVEDPVEARVTRDVRVLGKVAIGAGSRMLGSVTAVERGGKVKERARLGVRFHTLVLADGTRLPVQTETIYREGDSPGTQSAAKIGGAAVGGAILGAILGGGRGAAIGGSIGAAGGTAAVMAGDRKPAVLSAGSDVTVRIEAPVTVSVEQ